MKTLGVRMINIDFYPLLGGAQMHTLRLCRYLCAHGVNVEVITRHNPGLPQYEVIDGVPVYRTPILNESKAGAALSFVFFALQRLARTRDQYQIVHSHEMLSPMTIGLLARAGLGKRLVINPHRGGYLGDMYKMQDKARFAGKARLNWAAQRGDAFISVSKEISAELTAGAIPSEKIHFLPYALDTGQYRPLASDQRSALRTQLGLSGGLYACYTGRLVPEKGLDLLLQAWAEVLRQIPGARLLIVGDGDQRGPLEEQARQLKIDGNVQFSGAVPDTTPYLQACDVYVQPSFTEGLPISMLEAMSCSLPVLATAVGGVGDLLREHENGLLIAPHDPEILKTRLIELLLDTALREKLGAQARQDVHAYCAIEQIGQAHLDLYRTLAGFSPTYASEMA